MENKELFKDNIIIKDSTKCTIRNVSITDSGEKIYTISDGEKIYKVNDLEKVTFSK